MFLQRPFLALWAAWWVWWGKLGVWRVFHLPFSAGLSFFCLCRLFFFWRVGGVGVGGILKCEILDGLSFRSLLSGRSSFSFPFPFSFLFPWGSGWLFLSGFFSGFAVLFGEILILKHHTRTQNKTKVLTTIHASSWIGILSSTWSASCPSSFLPASTLFSVWSFARFFSSPLSASIGSVPESLRTFYPFFSDSASCRLMYLVRSVSFFFPSLLLWFPPHRLVVLITMAGSG